MKRILAFVWMPILIASESPVNLQKIQKQWMIIDSLTQEFKNLAAARKELKERIEEQAQFIDGLKKGEITLLSVQNVTIEDLEKFHADDIHQCSQLEQKAKTTVDQLERETWYLTGLEMRHNKEKSEGIPVQLDERHQREQARKDANLQKIKTAHDVATILQNSHRGKTSSEEQQILEAIINNIGRVEEAVSEFEKTLTQHLQETNGIPTDIQLQELQAIREKATSLKKEMAHILVQNHPDAKERADVIATLHAHRPKQEVSQQHQPTAVVQGHNPSAPRDTSKREVIINHQPSEVSHTA